MHFETYRWDKGIPRGLSPIEPNAEISFVLTSDPYGKRRLIEEWSFGVFNQVIYDSSLFDFRNLTPRFQVGWNKETLKEGDQVSLLIRDREHMPLFIEEHEFWEGRARKCLLKTAHGLLFGTQKILYTSLGDPFNGVILYDLLLKPVMIKKYITDEFGEFTELVEEITSGDLLSSLEPSLSL